jgi:hypothetical protein
MKALEDRLAEFDEAAIAILKQRGSTDATTLAAALGITPQAARRMMGRLKAQHRVHEQRAGRFITYIYGSNATPLRERSVPAGKFDGVNWASSTMRPGCQDFLDAPSLVHGEHIPHRAPMHGCVSSAARFSGEAK